MVRTAVGRTTNKPRRGGEQLVATRVAGLVDHCIDVCVHVPRPSCDPERVGAGGAVRRQRGCAGRDEDEESDSRVLLRDGRVDRGRIEPSWGGNRPDESRDTRGVAVHDGGTDVNGDGKLQANEVGVFSNVQVTTRSSEWIAFFNINGMKWHDGTQVEREDVLFGYHLASLAPAVTSSRFVKDKAGQAGSNYSSTRYQNINPVAIAGASTDGWLGGPVADTTHQLALKFIQTGPNAQFKRDTLQATFMPAYFWQGTGVRKVNGVIQPGAVHPDFGWAMNPDPAATGLSVYLNGIPAAGN